MIPLLGLFSWLLMGLAAGFWGRLFLPGEPRLGWTAAVSTGVLGALAGGGLATFLGYGGLAGYDVRSLLSAALAATASLLMVRTASLARA